MALVISQTESTYRFGIDTPPQFTGTGAVGSIAWSANRGTFAPTTTVNGAPTVLTPDNFSGDIVITGSDTGSSATATAVLSTLMVFPYQPDWKQAPSDKDDMTNSSKAEDGTESFLVKGEVQRIFKYAFFNRRQPEWVVVDALWDYHRKTLIWILADQPRSLPGTPEYVPVRFSAPLSSDPQGPNNMSYSFVAKEALDA